MKLFTIKSILERQLLEIVALLAGRLFASYGLSLRKVITRIDSHIFAVAKEK